MVTCCASLRWRWLLRTDLVEKLWWHFLRHFHKFQLSREIIASLYCLLISSKIPPTESFLSLLDLETLATKKVLKFDKLSHFLWGGVLPFYDSVKPISLLHALCGLFFKGNLRLWSNSGGGWWESAKKHQQLNWSTLFVQLLPQTEKSSIGDLPNH